MCIGFALVLAGGGGGGNRGQEGSLPAMGAHPVIPVSEKWGKEPLLHSELKAFLGSKTITTVLLC